MAFVPNRVKCSIKVSSSATAECLHKLETANHMLQVNDGLACATMASTAGRLQLNCLLMSQPLQQCFSCTISLVRGKILSQNETTLYVVNYNKEADFGIQCWCQKLTCLYNLDGW